MLIHQSSAVEDVLNRVLCSAFLKQLLSWYALCPRKLQHRVRLHKLIMRRTACHQHSRCSSGAQFTNTLKHARALLKRWRTIRQRRSAKHNDRVEVRLICIGRRNRLVRQRNRTGIHHRSQRQQKDSRFAASRVRSHNLSLPRSVVVVYPIFRKQQLRKRHIEIYCVQQLLFRNALRRRMCHVDRSRSQQEWLSPRTQRRNVRV